MSVPLARWSAQDPFGHHQPHVLGPHVDVVRLLQPFHLPNHQPHLDAPDLVVSHARSETNKKGLFICLLISLSFSNSRFCLTEITVIYQWNYSISWFHG